MKNDKIPVLPKQYPDHYMAVLIPIGEQVSGVDFDLSSTAIGSYIVTRGRRIDLPEKEYKNFTVTIKNT